MHDGGNCPYHKLNKRTRDKRTLPTSTRTLKVNSYNRVEVHGTYCIVWRSLIGNNSQSTNRATVGPASMHPRCQLLRDWNTASDLKAFMFAFQFMSCKALQSLQVASSLSATAASSCQLAMFKPLEIVSYSESGLKAFHAPARVAPFQLCELQSLQYCFNGFIFSATAASSLSACHSSNSAAAGHCQLLA